MQNNLITPNLVDRLKGVVTFKAPVYKAIAEDTTATNNSAIIVIVVSVIVGIVNGAISGSLIGGLITQVLAGVVGWAFSSWLTAFVAKKFFSGDTNTGEMLRVFGHSYIFQLVGIIPVIGPIIGSVLQAIGNFFGVREAAGVDNTKAIIIVIVAAVAALIIGFVLAAIAAAIGFGAGALRR